MFLGSKDRVLGPAWTTYVPPTSMGCRMPIDRHSNNCLPLSVAGYRWDRSDDQIIWSLSDEDWKQVFGEVMPRSAKELQDCLVDRDRPERQQALSRIGNCDMPVFVRFRFDCAAGAVWVQERLAPTDTPNVLEGEVAALSAEEAEIANLDGASSYDPLTGTFTRNRLFEGLQAAVSKAMATGGGGAFLVVDIDNFGQVNHALGCRAGDRLLIRLAERLRVSVGDGALLGRVGGDSFGIVAEGATEDSALAMAERVVRSVRDQPLCSDGDIVVTVSVGTVVFPTSACSAEEAMARADLAVASAKASGRNHFELYALSADQRAVQRRDLAIARRVQDAILEDRLEFAYQPIVRANWHQPAFYECLLRMRTPNNTLAPASQFIPLVEDSGLMRQVDHFVLEKAMAELSCDPNANLAINVSGHATSDRSWLNRLVALSEACGDANRRLIVEITETTAMRSPADASYFVDTLREMGTRVALDDFGAGYSSFRHLKALRVHMVKIDGLFTGKLAEHPENMLFFHVLLRLANGCGFETVAECAETSQDAVLLAGAGVTYLQGYYFAKPALERFKGRPVLPMGDAGMSDTILPNAPDRSVRAAS